MHPETVHLMRATVTLGAVNGTSDRTRCSAAAACVIGRSVRRAGDGANVLVSGRSISSGDQNARFVHGRQSSMIDLRVPVIVGDCFAAVVHTVLTEPYTR